MTASTTPDLETLGGRLRALADPNRLRILDRLRGGEHCVCDLTDVLDTGQSLLSFHLKVLRDAGLVTARREGRWMHYALETETLAELEDFLGSLRRRTSEARWKPVCCE
ncbi:MAG TPA: metalloregulator ArsR/SmtB family transcription factor [Gemmatimonadales bacterium]|nr:metalloregulator ArsR/SmtB family transcription factor [Gemmatimonadales bacterium]